MRYALAAVAGACLFTTGCAARASVAVEPEVAIVHASSAPAPEPNKVWVCHRGRWQEVGAPAADAHRRHGDRISTAAHRARASC